MVLAHWFEFARARSDKRATRSVSYEMSGMNGQSSGGPSMRSRGFVTVDDEADDPRSMRRKGSTAAESQVAITRALKRDELDATMPTAIRTEPRLTSRSSFDSP